MIETPSRKGTEAGKHIPEGEFRVVRTTPGGHAHQPERVHREEDEVVPMKVAGNGAAPGPRNTILAGEFTENQ